jgi:hypothetical protein
MCATADSSSSERKCLENSMNDEQSDQQSNGESSRSWIFSLGKKVLIFVTS